MTATAQPQFTAIITPRLALRQLAPTDAEAMYDLLGDPEAMYFMGRAFTRAECDWWINRNIQRYKIFGYGLWAVTLRESGELLGDCGLTWHEIDRDLQLEVGYHFRRCHWGHGYATEAARAAITWGFANIPVDHVISLIRPGNKPSRRVAERNGLVETHGVDWYGFEHIIYRMERARWAKLEAERQREAQ